MWLFFTHRWSIAFQMKYSRVLPIPWVLLAHLTQPRLTPSLRLLESRLARMIFSAPQTHLTHQPIRTPLFGIRSLTGGRSRTTQRPKRWPRKSGVRQLTHPFALPSRRLLPSTRCSAPQSQRVSQYDPRAVPLSARRRTRRLPKRWPVMSIRAVLLYGTGTTENLCHP